MIKSIDPVRGLVEVDANHPLAGEDLFLDLEVVHLTKGTGMRMLKKKRNRNIEPSILRWCS